MEQPVEEQKERITQEVNHIRGVIEAILFVNEKPVTLDQIKKVLDVASPSEIKDAIKEIQEEYESRKNGMIICEIAGGYQMLTNPLYASYVKEFYKKKHKEKLSKPALETLAIVAYKQPVTRADVETIRGVNSDGVVVHLIEKELIKVVGRKDVPGRPYIYGTTKQFLEYFGLKSLDDLPDLEEFPDLEPSDDDESEDDGESGEKASDEAQEQQKDTDSKEEANEESEKVKAGAEEESSEKKENNES